MSNKYKTQLDQYIREELDSPGRKTYREIMAALENMVSDYNKSDDRLSDLIPRVTKLMRKYEREELPFADMLTAVGMSMKDFQKYTPSRREDEIRDKFIDKVQKGKRQDWFSEFEQKWAEVERQQASRRKSPKKSKSKSSPKKSAKKSPKSPKKSSPKKSPPVNVLVARPKKRIVPTLIGPVSGPKKPSPLMAKAISGNAVPAITLMKAIDMSGRVMEAKVLKSKSPRKSTSRRKSPKKSTSRRKSAKKSTSRRVHRTKSDSARRRCKPGKEYHSPTRRCRKVKKMTCKQLRAWYETHKKN